MNWRPPWPICTRPALPPEIGVYLLVGLPDEDENEVTASIRRVKNWGPPRSWPTTPPSPAPPCGPGPECSRYDLAAEPLCQNNSLFPCQPQFSWASYTRLKRLAAGEKLW